MKWLLEALDWVVWTWAFGAAAVLYGIALIRATAVTALEWLARQVAWGASVWDAVNQSPFTPFAFVILLIVCVGVVRILRMRGRRSAWEAYDRDRRDAHHRRQDSHSRLRRAARAASVSMSAQPEEPASEPTAAELAGQAGEAAVREVLAMASCDSLHDIFIKTPEGEWTQLDHVLLLDECGALVVIETKTWNGRVKATTGATWTGVGKSGKRYTVKSPVLQNKHHQRALQRAVGGHWINLVVMAGDAEPPVLDGVVAVGDLGPQIYRLDMDLAEQATQPDPKHPGKTIGEVNAEAWARLNELHRTTDREKARREHLADRKSTKDA